MHKFYWLIPVLLIAFQLGLTLSSHQLRLEEVRASIRDVFWFQNRQLYTAEHSNIGWYATMMFIYNIFGFHLFEAKIFRLLLQLVSLYSLAAILKRYMGEKIAAIPLLIIGLSPMWLFFNTLQFPYGIDLQYFPIVLFLLLSSHLVLKFLGLMLAMIAWLSYPTFIFYLPMVAVIFLKNLPKSHHLRWIFLGIGLFLLPLVTALLYVKNPLLMIYDPYYQRGLFTAGGGLKFDGDLFAATLAATVENLFIRPTSYYLEIRLVEFSHFLPLVSFCWILVASISAFRQIKFTKLVIVLCWIVMIFNLVVTGFTIDGGIPGGRRMTPFLAAFYGLLVIVWYVSLTKKIRLLTPKLSMIILSILLLHHLLVYPFNLSQIKTLSPFAYNTWLSTQAPQQSLDQYVSAVQKADLNLDCETVLQKGLSWCEYSTIFSAVKGFCMWNHLQCYEIYGNLPPSGYKSLKIELWEGYDFEKN